MNNDHICGTPNAMCDMDCVERAYAPPPTRDITKEIALMALCAVQREYGNKLHPNMAKDVQIAIDGLRASAPVKPDALDDSIATITLACDKIKNHLHKIKDGLMALRELREEYGTKND